jgi:thymidylate kinase
MSSSAPNHDEGKVFTVALIGGDGSGKTTIARKLEQSDRIPAKRLYMGMSAQSSDIALPTTRLVLYVKRRSYRKLMEKEGKKPAERIPHHLYEYAPARRRPLWDSIRFLNRLAEAWYRQFISFRYRLRGYIVIYDRHFLFDSAPAVGLSPKQLKRRPNRLLYAILKRLYPRPNLTIFLDAPAEVLYARKGEASVEELDRRRWAVMEQGKQVKNFVLVDVTKPLSEVFEEVTQLILQYGIASGDLQP